MKNKIILNLLLLISVFATTGCGNASNQLTITDINGNTTELTKKELQEKMEGNSSSFNEKYVSGTITFTETIAKIEDASGVKFGTYSCGTFGRPYYQKVAKIEFENDWITLYVYKGVDEVDLDNLSKGDKVEVTTNISQYDNSYLSLASYDGEHCSFGTTPTVVTKK